ncbi:MAG: sigma-70 family RNA polymerase sigma factor [Candidatus Doudnabacteria bacterium]|jgi:RNA polymerase sigma-70 factor (ECF subfamily)
MDISSLIAKSAQGDQEAFGQLYDCFAQRIFRYVRVKIQNREEAQDVVQEVFTKTYLGLKHLNLENLNFTAWLYKVASNTINDHFRKKYSHPDPVEINESIDIQDGTSLLEEVSVNSDLKIVRAAFKRLPVIYRQVLELRFFQDLTLAEVATALNKSNLAVRILQHRALKKVQSIIKDKYDLV